MNTRTPAGRRTGGPYFLDRLPGPPPCTGRADLYTAETPTPGQQLTARALCHQCPVQEACRTYARDQRLYYIWGGESTRARTQAGYHPRGR
ncbi:WhiB family transcriptional regulator [Streptacidiphilus sp. PAMC 29251]